MEDEIKISLYPWHGKRCPKCEKTKFFEDFNEKDSYCKDCRKKYMNEYYKTK